MDKKKNKIASEKSDKKTIPEMIFFDDYDPTRVEGYGSGRPSTDTKRSIFRHADRKPSPGGVNTVAYIDVNNDKELREYAKGDPLLFKPILFLLLFQ